jgi:hypothetical protein
VASDAHLKQYTVTDLEKLNENVSDISKYACKRVTSVPMQNSKGIYHTINTTAIPNLNARSLRDGILKNNTKLEMILQCRMFEILLNIGLK